MPHTAGRKDGLGQRYPTRVRPAHARVEGRTWVTGKRKRYSAEFKAKVALEALRGELTTAQLATKHGIHQTMVGEWKKQAIKGLTAVFAGRSEAELTAKSTEAEVEKLHAKIGQLLVERDFLAKASGR